MNAVLSSFTILSVLYVLTNAIAFLPQPTGQRFAPSHHAQGRLGWPTPSPDLELVKRRLNDNMNVAKRATISFTSGEFLGFIAPDNTCGYINGQFGMFGPCFSHYVCV